MTRRIWIGLFMKKKEIHDWWIFDFQSGVPGLKKGFLWRRPWGLLVDRLAGSCSAVLSSRMRLYQDIRIRKGSVPFPALVIQIQIRHGWVSHYHHFLFLRKLRFHRTTNVNRSAYLAKNDTSNLFIEDVIPRLSSANELALLRLVNALQDAIVEAFCIWTTESSKTSLIIEKS